MSVPCVHCTKKSLPSQRASRHTLPPALRQMFKPCEQVGFLVAFGCVAVTRWPVILVQGKQGRLLGVRCALGAIALHEVTPQIVAAIKLKKSRSLLNSVVCSNSADNSISPKAG